MQYWRGMMNWPLDRGWRCEICGVSGALRGLMWGFVHAECRCNQCHAVYRMRNPEGDVVSTPILNMRDEFIHPAKVAMKKISFGTMEGDNLSALTQEQWQGCGVPQDAFTD